MSRGGLVPFFMLAFSPPLPAATATIRALAPRRFNARGAASMQRPLRAIVVPPADEVVDDSEPEREQRRQEERARRRTRRKLDHPKANNSIITLDSDSNAASNNNRRAISLQDHTIIDITGKGATCRREVSLRKAILQILRTMKYPVSQPDWMLLLKSHPPVPVPSQAARAHTVSTILFYPQREVVIRAHRQSIRRYHKAPHCAGIISYPPQQAFVDTVRCLFSSQRRAAAPYSHN